MTPGKVPYGKYWKHQGVSLTAGAQVIEGELDSMLGVLKVAGLVA